MRFITGDECGLIKECSTTAAAAAVKRKEPREAAANAPQTITHTIITDNHDDNNDGSDDDKAAIRLINTHQPPMRRRGVVALAWTNNNQQQQQLDQQQFASLHMDGVVEFWQRSSSPSSYRRAGRISNVFGTSENTTTKRLDPLSQPLGLYSFGDPSSDGSKTLLCATNRSGKVVVLDPAFIAADTDDDDSKSDDNSSMIRSSFHAFHVQNQQQRKQSKTDITPHSVVSATAVDTHHGRVAAGGKERDVVLWDLSLSLSSSSSSSFSSRQPLWKAKNLPPDAQTLLSPLVWPTAICFFNNNNHHNQNLMAVGSTHREVRIYDVRIQGTTPVSRARLDGDGGAKALPQQQQQRRPILTTPHGMLEQRVTSLCPLADDDYRLAVGDAAGGLQMIDLRKLGKKERVRKSIYNSHNIASHGRFVVGPAGSVRQVIVGRQNNSTTTRRWLAAVGLDRMLRVYNAQTHRQVNCFYLKQRLNCVLMMADGRGDDDDDDDNEARGDDDDDDIDQEDIVDDYVDSDLEQQQDEESGDDSSQQQQRRRGQLMDKTDGDDDSDHDSEDSSSEDEDRESDKEEEEEESEDEEHAFQHVRKKRRH